MITHADVFQKNTPYFWWWMATAKNEIVLRASDSRLYVYGANDELCSGCPISLGDVPDIYLP